MYTMYYSMMEKYSNYTVEQLSKKGINLEKNWQELKKELINSCDIKKVNYHLDLLDEKRIGKAKVINPVITEEEVYQALDSVELTKNNASILTRIKKENYEYNKKYQEEGFTDVLIKPFKKDILLTKLDKYLETK